MDIAYGGMRWITAGPACAGHAAPCGSASPRAASRLGEMNERPDRELMRDGRWLV